MTGKADFDIFFDKGSPWTPCSPSHPDARAFGPTGFARQLDAPLWRDAPADELSLDADGYEWLLVSDRKQKGGRT